MVGNTLSPGQMLGNIAAFSMPISFAVLILVVRKYPNVDMVPSQFIAGIFALMIGYLMSGKLLYLIMIFFRISCRFFFSLVLVYFYNNRSSTNTFSNGWNYNVNRGCFWTFMGYLSMNSHQT